MTGALADQVPRPVLPQGLQNPRAGVGAARAQGRRARGSAASLAGSEGNEPLRATLHSG